MFNNAGLNSADSFEISSIDNWNVSKVTSHESFNMYVDSKIIPPVWVEE